MAGSKPTPAGVGEQLIDLLKKAKPADVEKLDEAIKEKEEALAVVNKTAIGEIRALKRTRKMLAIATGLEQPKKFPARKKATDRPAAGGPGAAAGSNRDPARTEADDKMLKDRRMKVLRILCDAGMLHWDALTEKSGISPFGRGAMGQVLTHEWFHINGDKMVSCTDKGDRASLI